MKAFPQQPVASGVVPRERLHEGLVQVPDQRVASENHELLRSSCHISVRMPPRVEALQQVPARVGQVADSLEARQLHVRAEVLVGRVRII